MCEKLTKKCSKCGEVKELGEFYVVTKRGKPYRMASCKKCGSRDHKKYRETDKLQQRRKRKINKEKNQIFFEECEKHPEFLDAPKICTGCKLTKTLKDFPYAISFTGGFASKCKQCKKEYDSRPECKDRKKKGEQKRIAKLKSTPEGVAHIAAIKKRYMVNNLDARIKSNLRHRVALSILKGYKSDSTFNLIGCSVEFLKKHIEAQWEEGMNWANYGTEKKNKCRSWNFEHIIPCALFNMKDPTQQRECFNWKNLAPAWELDNSKKLDTVCVNGKNIRGRDLKHETLSTKLELLGVEKKNPTENNGVVLEHEGLF
jgi:hypothetical protein